MLGRRAQGSRYVLRYVGLFTSLRHSRRFTRACRTQRRTVCNRSLLLACRAGYMAARGSRVTAGSPLSLSLSLSRSLSCALSISLYHSRTNSGKSHPSLRSLALAALARSLSVSRRQCSRTRDRILCNNTPAKREHRVILVAFALSPLLAILYRTALLSRARSIDREELLSQRATDIGVRQWRI